MALPTMAHSVIRHLLCMRLAGGRRQSRWSQGPGSAWIGLPAKGVPPDLVVRRPVKADRQLRAADHIDGVQLSNAAVLTRFPRDRATLSVAQMHKGGAILIIGHSAT
jgi:hypothetical protein